MSINLEALKVLRAVVAQGSFAKASEVLHKTPSAISYQLNNLESQLGAEVLDRSKYRTELTEVGERILEEGCKLLDQAEYVELMVEQFSEGWEPNLELVVDGMLPTGPILKVLKEMSDLDIPTRIQFRIEFLEGVQKRFEQSNADLMITLDYQKNTRCIASPLNSLEALLVVSADHSLASCSLVDLSDLQDSVELTVRDSSYDTAYGGPLTFGSERIFYLSDFQTKKAALLEGLGYGWMPKYMIEDELSSNTLCEVHYTGGQSHEYHPLLVGRRNQPLGKAGVILKDKLLRAL